jgi:hypothetical protein
LTMSTNLPMMIGGIRTIEKSRIIATIAMEYDFQRSLKNQLIRLINAKITPPKPLKY